VIENPPLGAAFAPRGDVEWALYTAAVAAELEEKLEEEEAAAACSRAKGRFECKSLRLFATKERKARVVWFVKSCDSCANVTRRLSGGSRA